MAQLAADSASYAKRVVDMGFAVLEGDRRAADVHAGMAAAALAGVHLKGCLMFDVFQQSAGAP